MKTAYLGLGSNLGDRRAYLAEALRRIVSDDVVLVRVSSVYETAPVGVTEQPDFLNLVAELRTALPAQTLLARCLAVEAELGRERRERWGPRTIDLDLLWQEGERVDSPGLTLPHPRLTERSFVLVPLAEIAPELLLDGQTAAARAAAMSRTGLRKLGPLPAPGDAR